MESPGQAAAEVDAGYDIVPIGIQLPNRAAQPATIGDMVRLGGVSDIHRPEVRTVWLWVANTVDDRQLAIGPKVLHRAHARVEPPRAVKVDHVVFCEMDRFSGVVVNPVGIRHDSIHRIVPS